jgi:hypothetical protein
MSVLVAIHAQKAFFRDGQWRSADRQLERRLNEFTASWIRQTGGPKLSDRDPELTCAAHVAGQFEGRVLRHVPARRPEEVRHRFVSRRQMSLF